MSSIFYRCVAKSNLYALLRSWNEKYKFAKWVEESEPKLKQLIKRNLLVKPSHHQPRETEHEGDSSTHLANLYFSYTHISLPILAYFSLAYGCKIKHN
jgi:hypothetical protein